MKWIVVDEENDEIVYVTSEDNPDVSIPITQVLQVTGAEITLQEGAVPCLRVWAKLKHEWRPEFE